MLVHNGDHRRPTGRPQRQFVRWNRCVSSPGRRRQATADVDALQAHSMPTPTMGALGGRSAAAGRKRGYQFASPAVRGVPVDTVPAAEGE